MAYSETLADRLRDLMIDLDPAERKMFGGLCFMVNGNMAVGIVKDDLMVRVGKEGHDAAISQPGARPMDFTGRPMRGMVFVDHQHIEADQALQQWIDRSLAFVRTLPAK